jgi:hypothetical protein
MLKILIWIIVIFSLIAIIVDEITAIDEVD